MTTAACGVCQGNLFRSRNSANIAYNFPKVSLTSCGHIHHRKCITTAFGKMRSRNQGLRCPLCQVEVNQRLHRVQLSVGFPELVGLYLENVDLKNKLQHAEAVISEQQNEINVLRHRLEAENGARIIQPEGIFFNFSSCYNCESQTHTARDCQRFPVMRFHEQRPGTSRLNLASSFFVTFAYNESAAVVVRNMEKLLGWDKYDRRLTRNEVLVAFAVVFFHQVCWRCYAYTHREQQCPEINLWNPSNDLDDCEEMKRILVEKYPDLG